MTKEEYEKLLKSDYWRGYSYSLIKERNFTCEDCGRRFPNERNKLQVHHLVYRDVNPWSYKPEEVVVLCEECHKKRHGIPTGNEEAAAKEAYAESYSQGERVRFYVGGTGTVSSSDNIGSRYSWPEEEEKRFKVKYVIYGLVAFFVLCLGFSKLHNRDAIKTPQSVESSEMNTANSGGAKVKRAVAKRKNKAAKEKVTAEDPFEEVERTVPEQSSLDEPLVAPQENVVADKPITDNPVTVPQEDDRLSTLELLERKNHEDVVRRAKRAGVSTEGSTVDILERINHADVVKRAKRAGVSTEGSTSDILERINHADVVKRAKRMGVSTEGSTMDILERITRKNLESR